MAGDYSDLGDHLQRIYSREMFVPMENDAGYWAPPQNVGSLVDPPLTPAHLAAGILAMQMANPEPAPRRAFFARVLAPLIAGAKSWS